MVVVRCIKSVYCLGTDKGRDTITSRKSKETKSQWQFDNRYNFELSNGLLISVSKICLSELYQHDEVLHISVICW